MLDVARHSLLRDMTIAQDLLTELISLLGIRNSLGKTAIEKLSPEVEKFLVALKAALKEIPCGSDDSRDNPEKDHPCPRFDIKSWLCPQFVICSWLKTKVQKALFVGRILSSGTFLIVFFAAIVNFTSQVFFELRTHPPSEQRRWEKFKYLWYLCAPLFYIVSCVILQESLKLVQSPAGLYDYRKKILLSLYQAKNIFFPNRRATLAHDCWTLALWIDFWFLGSLPFPFLAGLFGILALWTEYAYYIGVVCACALFGFGCLLLGRVPYLESKQPRPCLDGLYFATPCLAVVFGLVAFVSPMHVFRVVCNGAMINIMLWTFCTVLLRIFSVIFLYIWRIQGDEVQRLAVALSLAHFQALVGGSMHESSEFFNLLDGGINCKWLEGDSIFFIDTRKDNITYRLNLANQQMEAHTKRMESNLCAMCESFFSGFNDQIMLTLWLAYTIWFIGLVVGYFQWYIAAAFFLAVSVRVLTLTLGDRFPSLMHRKSPSSWFLYFFMYFGVALSILLSCSASPHTSPDGRALIQWGGSKRTHRASYFACQGMWGASGTGPLGLGLSLLDMALLSQYAFASNQSYHNALLEASFGSSTASTIHFDNDTELPRVVGTCFHGRVKGANDTIVLAIRGTASSADWLADFSLFTFVASLQISSYIGINAIAVLPLGFIRGLMQLLHSVGLGHRQDEEQHFRNRLMKITDRARTKFPNATILFTGHSLGGSFAAQAGALFHNQAIVFSAPGQHYSRTRFKFKKEDSYRHILNIVPEYDLVPKVDFQDATVQKINCLIGNETSLLSRGWLCHNLLRTTCELWRACGDAVGRNFSGAAGWEHYGTKFSCESKEQFAYIGED